MKFDDSWVSCTL